MVDMYDIIRSTSKAMRRDGVSNAEIKAYQNEATSGDYDHLVRATMKWIAPPQKGLIYATPLPRLRHP